MSCSVNSSEFLPIIDKLYQHDRNRFNNYDNVAKVIFKITGTEQTRAIALLKVAEIFSNISSQFPESFQKGNADKVLSLDALESKEFLTQFSKLMGISGTGKQVTQEYILAHINALSGVIFTDDIKEIFSDLQILKSFSHPTEEAKVKLLTDLVETLKKVVSERATNNIELVLRTIDDLNNELLTYSTYVPFRDSAIGLDTLLITTRNLETVEGIYNSGQYETLDGDIIKKDEILRTRKSLPLVDKTHGPEHIFSQSAIKSGLRFVATSVEDAHGEDKKDATGLLAGLTPEHMAGKIQIFAITSGTIGDERVNRAKNAAVREGKEPTNRTRETFENQQQQDKLRNTKTHAEVLGVSRQMMGDGFSIAGKVKGENALFSIYTHENLTIVDNTNHTIPFDFSNPDHISKLKSLARLRTRNGSNFLSDADINSLISADRYYKEFAKKVNDLLLTNPSADITELFLKYYNINTVATRVSDKGPEILLNDYIQKHDEVAPEYKVVSLYENDEADHKKGDVIENASQQINVPFILRKKQSGNVVSSLEQYENLNTTSRWEVLNTLGPNQRVMHNGLPLTQQQLFEAIFSKDNSDKGLLARKAAFEFSQVPPNGDYVMIRYSGSTIQFHPLTVNTDSRDVRFANAVTTLLTDVEGKDQTSQDNLLQTFKDKWWFTPLHKTTGSEVSDAFHIQISITDSNGQKALQIKVYNKDPKTDAIEKFSAVYPKEFFASTSDFAQRFGNDFKNKLSDFLKNHPDPSLVEAVVKELTYKSYVPNLLVAATDNKTGKYKLRLGADSLDTSDFTTNVIENNNLYIERKISTDSSAGVSKIAQVNGLQEVASDKVVYEDDEIGGFESLQEDNFNTSYSQPYTEERLASESAWLADKLPQFNLSKEDVTSLLSKINVDGTVLGFIEGKVIYLNKTLATGGTIFHEAFHGVFGNMLSTEQQKYYTDKIIGDKKYAAHFTDKALTEFARRRKINKSHDQVKSLVAEEILAEGFRSHMQNKDAKGIFKKLYNLIKKFIALFKNNPTRLYDRIDSGFYKDNALHVQNRDRAYQLLETRGKLYEKEYGVTPVRQYLSIADQADITYRIVDEMLHASNTGVVTNGINTRLTDREKFDSICDTLAKGDFSIDGLINKNQVTDKALQEKIRAKYDSAYANIAAILGVNGSDFVATYDNGTSNKRNDNKVVENTTTLNNKDEITTVLKNSNEVLFQQVKELLKHLRREKKYVDQTGETNTDESITEDNRVNGVENTSDENDTDENPLGENYDNTSLNINVIDTIRYEVRRFLSVIKYEQVDPELGIKVPHMVDGVNIFNVLLKITANCTPEEIFSFENGQVNSIIKSAADQFEDDGHHDISDMLKAVFKTIEDSISVTTETGDKVISNSDNNILVKQLISTFHNAEIELLQSVNSINTWASPGQIENDEVESAVRSTVTEKLVSGDVKQRMSTFESMINATILKVKASEKAKKEFKAVVSSIKADHNKITTSSKSKQITEVATLLAPSELKTLVDSLFDKYQKIGLQIPRSLIKFSILAIDRVENNVSTDTGIFKDLNMYSSNITNGQYLPKTFFSSLNNVLDKMAEGVEWNDLFSYAEGKKKTPLNPDAEIVRSSLKSAMGFVVKFDPMDAPSMVINAEGKPIYRYTKYSPLIMMVQDFNKNLRKALESSTLYDDFLQDWYTHNPLIAKALSTTTTSEEIKNGRDVEKMQMRLFVQNMQIYVNGGLLVMKDGTRQSADEYKHMGSKQLYIQTLGLFANRKIASRTMSIQNTDTNEARTANVESITFARNMSQQEGSQTNYLIDSFYKRYERQVGAQKHKPAVDQLIQFAWQEFERIRKEWKDKENKLANYNTEHGNTLVLGYNSKKSDEITVDDKSLRAYNFQMLNNVFGTGYKDEDVSENTRQVREDLLAIARGETNHEDGSEIGFAEAVSKTGLRGMLNDHMETSFQAHLDQLNSFGIINHNETNAAGNKVVTFSKENNFKQIKQGIRVMDLLRNAESVDDAYKYAYDNVEDFVYDSFMNTYINGITVNQLFDGDPAMGIKNEVDYFKRNKKNLAAGEHMNRMVTSAFLDTLFTHMNSTDILSGQYDTEQELQNHYSSKEEYVDAMKGTSSGVKVFDGQSIASMMHRIDLEDDLGKLSGADRELLLAMNYRSLTEGEIRQLENSNIVINSAKTVVASKENYLKMSEHTYLRSDSSILIDPVTGRPIREENVEAFQKMLHDLYSQIYDLRQSLKDTQLRNRDVKANDIQRADVEDKVKELYKVIHDYWMPVKGREMHHMILNSMEFHNIDMLMDTEASKTVTFMTTNINDRKTVPQENDTTFQGSSDGKSYISLNRSKKLIDGRYKFLQVVTSGQHEEAKSSVQAKMLLTADIHWLISQLGTQHATSAQRGAIVNRANRISKYFEDFKSTLSESALARYDNLMQTYRDENHNLIIGEFVDSIRKSLADRGSDSNTMKYFEIDTEGNPVFDVDNPIIRAMFQAKFFAHYSKTVFDEHVKGNKYIHASSYGYKLIVNKNTGEVVPMYEYKKNPAAYSGEEYTTRYPGVSVETHDEVTMVKGKKVTESVKTYFVEAIVPMPMFKSDSERELYMDKMNKLFATRIPTEDKRSMIALKIVDWIDSSYRNTIIVPQLVHLLAGSDLDIDSIYTHEYASYSDIFGEAHVYGDYSKYITDQSSAKYLEYLYSHYSKNKSDINPVIKDLLDLIKTHPEELQSDEVDRIMKIYGLDDFKELNTRLSEYTALNDQLDKLSDSYFTLRDSNEWLDEQESGDLADWNSQGQLSKERRDLKETVEEKRATMKQFVMPYLKSYVQFKAIIDDLSEKGLVASKVAYDETSVVPADVHQNRNLDARLGMLSNEDVFNRLYKNERTDSSVFGLIAKNIIGESPESVAQKFDRYTIDGVVLSNNTNSSSKMGISFAATANKLCALGSAYKLLIKPENTAWQIEITGKDGKTYLFNKLGQAIVDGASRPSQMVGSSLGMFADGAKEPIPAVLQINDVNASVMLSMMSIGMPEDMSVMFNFIPELRDAVQDVINGGKKEGQYVVQFADAIRKRINFRTGDQKSLKDKVIKEIAGLVLDPKKPGEFDRSQYSIKYTTPAILDKSRREGNTLSLKDLGFEVSFNGKEMSADAQKYIVLQSYLKQITLSQGMLDANRMISLLKSMKPDYAVLDKTADALEKLRHNDSVFLNSSSIFTTSIDNQLGSVFNVLEHTVHDMLDQSEKIHFSRQKSFTFLKSLFSQALTNNEVFTDILLQNFVMQKLRNQISNDKTISIEEANTLTNNAIAAGSILKARLKVLNTTLKNGTELTSDQQIEYKSLQKQIRVSNAEIKNASTIREAEKLRSTLSELFNSRFWFGGTSTPEITNLKQDMIYLIEQYPANSFVKSIGLFNKDDEKIPYQVLQINTKSKYDNTVKERTIDGYMELLKSADDKTKLIALKLAMHELVRNGFNSKPGSFMKFIDPNLFNGAITKYLNQNKAITDLKASFKSPEGLIDFLGEKSTLQQVMRDMYLKLVNEVPTHPQARDNKVYQSIKIETAEDHKTASLIFGKPFTNEVGPKEKRVQVSKKEIKEIDYVTTVAKPDEIINGKKVKTYDRSITFNMTSKEISAVSAQSVLKNFKIQNSTVTGRYIFPATITTFSGTVYILQKLAVGENPKWMRIDEVLAHEEHNTTECSAVAAKYIEMPPLSVSNISLTSFTEQQAKEFMAYATGDKPVFEKTEPTVPVNPGKTEYEEKVETKEIKPACK
jgi:hypothetical protein